jgi:hypothetical protein
MVLRQYFPLSVGLFVLVILAAHFFKVPVLPFAVVLLVGETLLGFELEDHRVAKVAGDFLKALRPTPRPR